MPLLQYHPDLGQTKPGADFSSRYRPYSKNFAVIGVKEIPFKRGVKLSSDQPENDSTEYHLTPKAFEKLCEMFSVSQRIDLD